VTRLSFKAVEKQLISDLLLYENEREDNTWKINNNNNNDNDRLTAFDPGQPG